METVIVLYITYQEGMVTGLRLKTISLNFDRFFIPLQGPVPTHRPSFHIITKNYEIGYSSS